MNARICFLQFYFKQLWAPDKSYSRIFADSQYMNYIMIINNLFDDFRMNGLCRAAFKGHGMLPPGAGRKPGDYPGVRIWSVTSSSAKFIN
ncbi:hypothetical protein [Acidocella aquatica]|uniref:hypothetical protein n=1 Tax=Acidocella aquatica TaxID=1922313 RepID=UPI0024E12D26|nr:hypothetical protein [Acidocella aquatica]